MAIASSKKTFYIPESYTFKSGYINPSTVVSLTPSISSSNYVGGLRSYSQQNKFSLVSTASSLLPSHVSSVGIHTIDDDSLEDITVLEQHFRK